MENARVSGTVQWFSRVKGYGFIRPDGLDEDVFVHYSVIQGEGYRNLNKGQRVELTVEDSPKGPQAVDVVGVVACPTLSTGLPLSAGLRWAVRAGSAQLVTCPFAITSDGAAGAC